MTTGEHHQGQQLSEESNRTLTLSQRSLATAPAIKTLCSMKSQAQFTPHQLATWAAVLSQYEAAIVNEAVLHLGLSPDPFPDLAKLVAACERIRAELNPQVIRGEPSGKLSAALIASSAEALGLSITKRR